MAYRYYSFMAYRYYSFMAYGLSLLFLHGLSPYYSFMAYRAIIPSWLIPTIPSWLIATIPSWLIAIIPSWLIATIPSWLIATIPSWLIPTIPLLIAVIHLLISLLIAIIPSWPIAIIPLLIAIIPWLIPTIPLAYRYYSIGLSLSYSGAMTSLILSRNELGAEGAKHIAAGIRVSKRAVAVVSVPCSCRSDLWLNCCCLLLSTPGYGGYDEPQSCME